MKKALAITLALFCAGLFVKAVHAADNSTEFGVADDLGVFGTGGTAADPDVEIKGFTVFGSTHAPVAGMNIPAAPGNIFINGYVEVSSGMYVNAPSTFTGTMNLPNIGKIFINDGSTGQILRKAANGWLEWGAAAVTGSGTQYKIPLWNAAGGTQLGDSLLVQDSAGTYVYIGGTTLFKVTAASGNTLIGGTLDVTGLSSLGALNLSGAAVFSDKLHVAGTATLVSSVTIKNALGVSGAVTLSTNTSVAGALKLYDNLNVSSNTILGGTLNLTGDAVLSAKLHAAGTATIVSSMTVKDAMGVTGDLAVNANKFNVTASNGNTAVAGTLNVTGVVTASQFGTANTETHGVNQAAESGVALAVQGTATSGQFLTKFYSNTSLAAWLKNK